MTTKDYLAALRRDDGDAVQYGIPGMKWGKRKTDKSSGTATSVSGEQTASKRTGPETSSERYTRLLAKAKTDGANSFSEDELRFVTARGNAIAQVERLNSSKPNWASEAAKQVVKQIAQEQIKNLSKKAIKKYLTS